MTRTVSPEKAIRRIRELSNRRIAGHDADGAVALMVEDVTVMPSGGTLLTGRDAVRAALSASFSDPDFITFRRAADRIVAGPDDDTAEESGRWKGLWKAGSGRDALGGTYSARWRFDGQTWLILSETFIPETAAR